MVKTSAGMFSIGCASRSVERASFVFVGQRRCHPYLNRRDAEVPLQELLDGRGAGGNVREGRLKGCFARWCAMVSISCGRDAGVAEPLSKTE